MKHLKSLLKVAIFIIGLGLVVVGQKVVGYPQAIMMLVGLGLLLSLVYSYNKKFNH